VARVLFINPNEPDYLADGVFHGLRSLLGADAVDYPRADYLYETVDAAALRRFWGGGFTLYGRLPDLPMDRGYMLVRALDGEFDLVIFGDIWRTFGLWTEWAPRLRKAGVALAALDGSDNPAPYPYHWRWWRRPSWWFLPRAHNRATSFKREITPTTRWYASYLLLPPVMGRSLGLLPTAISIPAEKVAKAPPIKDKDFPRHIVDPELAARLESQTGHVFTDEDEYFDDLRRSRFGVTLKRGGWDALRHYEIAASGAVPCFRDLHRKPTGCAPHGLDGANSVTYRDVDDLNTQIAELDEAAYSSLQAGALRWAERNTTIARAVGLLRACNISATDGRPRQT
jgi:hypothetical protein